MIPWLLVVPFLLGGEFLSDFLWKKTASVYFSRALSIGLSFLLAGACFYCTLFASSLEVNLLLLSLGLAFAFLPNACFFSLNADLFSHRLASAQGVTSSFFAFSGAFLR